MLTLRCRVTCEEDSATYNPHLRIFSTKEVYRDGSPGLYEVEESPIDHICNSASPIRDYEYRITALSDTFNESIAMCLLFYQSDSERNFTEYCSVPTLVWIVLPEQLQSNTTTPADDTVIVNPIPESVSIYNISSTESPISTTAEATHTVYVYTPATTITDSIITTERCTQTPDGTNVPTSTPSVPSETMIPVLSPRTGVPVSLVTGISLSTSILVFMIVMLVLIVVILWVKLRTVSADLRVQKAMCNTRSKPDQSEIRINKALSDSERERNENSPSDIKL